MRTWTMRRHLDGRGIGLACLLVGDVAEMLLMVHLHMENMVSGNCVVVHSRCKGSLNRVNGLLTPD